MGWVCAEILGLGWGFFASNFVRPSPMLGLARSSDAVVRSEPHWISSVETVVGFREKMIHLMKAKLIRSFIWQGLAWAADSSATKPDNRAWPLNCSALNANTILWPLAPRTQRLWVRGRKRFGSSGPCEKTLSLTKVRFAHPPRIKKYLIKLNP
jgi:hypothetical protein